MSIEKISTIDRSEQNRSEQEISDEKILNLFDKIESYQEIPEFAKKILYEKIKTNDLDTLNEGDGINFIFKSFNILRLLIISMNHFYF